MSTVGEGQCVPIEQETSDYTSNPTIKQENQDISTVWEGQCVPTKVEPSAIPVSLS